MRNIEAAFELEILKDRVSSLEKLASSGKKASTGLPVYEAVKGYWNDINDMASDLEDTLYDYESVVSSGGDAKRDAETLVEEIESLIESLREIAREDVAKVTKLERRFVDKHGEPEEYVERIREERFPS